MSTSSTNAPRNPSVLGSSAVMAAGTVISRITGFGRTTLLAAALGTALHADVFNIANTIPNMLYILLAGGIFNAVLVPQLVRAMQNDADGGQGYTNRIITLAAVFLIAVTAIMVVAAPIVMRIILDPAYFSDPGMAAHRESVIMLARYCLPQVFFYGMFVLLSQVLNARGSFGPMMWAPIANNVISIGVLASYLWLFSAAVDPCVESVTGVASHNTTMGAFSSSQELLLGLGSTFGIVVQFLVLLPYLRKTGFTYRPQWDFRGSGLGHTLRLGSWTVAFVIVNQIAYTVVIKIASAGTTTTSMCSGDGAGTGYTIYSNAFLLVMVPHAVITVSLATAMLPQLSRLAATANLSGLADAVTTTIRTTYALVLPLAALLPLVAFDLANLIWGYGAAKRSFTDFVPTLMLFSVGLVFFTCHYLLLRAYYALEQTKEVFWIQCGVAATNIVAAIVLTRGAPAAETAPRLVVAYTAAYMVGAATSWFFLSRQLGGLWDAQLTRFAVRLGLAVSLTVGAGALLRWGISHLWVVETKLAILAHLVAVGGGSILIYMGLAWLLRLSEVTQILHLMVGRLARRN